MEKRVHLILSSWIVSHVGHAVLSVFYEQSPATFVVPTIYAAFILLNVGAWRRNPWSAAMCMITAVVTILLQGIFMWKREAYGSLSIPVLVFDIMGMIAALLYLVFFFSPQRERYFQKS